MASWTPYEWRRAHERGSGGDSEVGQGADWREAIRAKVKEGPKPVASYCSTPVAGPQPTLLDPYA